MRKRTDFHFKVEPDLRDRLRAAREKITVRTAAGLETRPSITDLITAGAEMLVERVEKGISVVDAPRMRARAAVQDTPYGPVSALSTADLYRELAESGRQPTLEEQALFRVDARHLALGAEVVPRGAHFTGESAELEEKLGERGIVKGRPGGTIEVGFAGGSLRVHPWDLVPADRMMYCPPFTAAAAVEDKAGGEDGR